MRLRPLLCPYLASLAGGEFWSNVDDLIARDRLPPAIDHAQADVRRLGSFFV